MQLAIPKLGLYVYSIAAIEIAESNGLDSTSLNMDMASAIRSGRLVVRDPFNGAISQVDHMMDNPSPYVSPSDVNTWLSKEGRSYRWTPGKKRRITTMKAFLLDCFKMGIDKNIESVWIHIKANAGKNGFLFVAAGQSSAVFEVEEEKGKEEIKKKRITKSALSKTLARLINQQNH